MIYVWFPDHVCALFSLSHFLAFCAIIHNLATVNIKVGQLPSLNLQHMHDLLARTT